MNKKFFLIICLVLFLIPSTSHAFLGCDRQIMPCGYDMDGDGTYELETTEDKSGDLEINWEGCRFIHIFALINNILVYVITCLAPIIVGIMVILGGGYVMIAGVDPAKMKKGTDMITAAIVGLIIIFVAWVLLNTFLTSMGVAEWTGLEDWWQFNY